VQLGFLQRDDSIAAAAATQSTPWFCVIFSHDSCSQFLPQDPYPKTQIITLFLGVAGFRNSGHHGNVTQFSPFNLPFSGLGSQELGNVTSYGCCWGHASSSAVVVVVVREILVLKPETKKKCRENTQLGIERTNKHCKTEFIQR